MRRLAYTSILVLGLGLLLGAETRRPAPLKIRQICADTPPQRGPALPYGPGEELGFLVKVKGVYVGRAKLRFGERTEEQRQVLYAAHGQATTNSFFGKLSKVESTMTSLIALDGVMPYSSYSRATSEKREREDRATFDPARRQVAAELRLDQQRWAVERVASQPIQDVISVIYYARSRELAVGTRYCVDLYYGRRLWHVNGRVLRAETLSTVAGPYKALVFDGEAVPEGQRPQARRFTVWMSDDEDRLPLRLTSPSPWGEIEVTIEDFKRGRRLVQQRTASNDVILKRAPPKGLR